MTPDECRAEQVTIDEMDAAMDETNLQHTSTLMQVTSAKALWEIAAQLSELNQQMDYHLTEELPSLVVSSVSTLVAQGVIKGLKT